MQNTLGQQNIQQNVPLAQYQQQGVQNVPIQQPAMQQPQMAMPQQAAPVTQCQPAQNCQPNAQNVQVPNYSGVNIQIFNPSVTPPGANAPVYNVNAPNYGPSGANGCYPSGYYTNTWGNNSTDNNKKTEKREIVQLTDDYIRNLENYLNSQDKEVRLMGAKEVIARLNEDNSRKDDKALNALINKMLQDPSTPVRALALGALNSRTATGDNFTVNLLQQMQQSNSGYGMDAVQATNALLKMSGQTVEKEFEVKSTDKPKTEEKK